MIRVIILSAVSLPLGFVLYVLTNVLLAQIIEASGLGSEYPQLTIPNQLSSDVHLIASFVISYILLSKILKRKKEPVK